MGQVGSGATEARRSAELAAWQAVLPSLYPEIAGEAVVDVVAISSGRILLLTDAHIAMLKVNTAPALFNHAGSALSKGMLSKANLKCKTQFDEPINDLVDGEPR